MKFKEFSKKGSLLLLTSMLFVLFTAFDKHDLKLESNSIDYLNKKYPKSIYKGASETYDYDVYVELGKYKNIDEKDLAYLKNINNIVKVDISESKVADIVLENLQASNSVEVMFLDESNITDKGFQMICRNYPNLGHLSLYNTKITSEGLKYIGNLKKLTQLDLRGTPVDDLGVKYISELENMRELSFSTTKITDKSVPELMKFRKLDNLYLSYSGMTEEGVVRLKEFYKNANIKTNVEWYP